MGECSVGWEDMYLTMCILGLRSARSENKDLFEARMLINGFSFISGGLLLLSGIIRPCFPGLLP